MSDVATEQQKETKQQPSFGPIAGIALGLVIVVGLLFAIGGYGIAIHAAQEANQGVPSDDYNEKAIDALLMIGLGAIIVVLALGRIPKNKAG